MLKVPSKSFWIRISRHIWPTSFTNCGCSTEHWGAQTLPKRCKVTPMIIPISIPISSKPNHTAVGARVKRTTTWLFKIEWGQSFLKQQQKTWID